MTPAELASAYAALLDSVKHARSCAHYEGYSCACDRLQRQGELVRRMVEVAGTKGGNLFPGWEGRVHAAALTVRPE